VLEGWLGRAAAGGSGSGSGSSDGSGSGSGSGCSRSGGEGGTCLMGGAVAASRRVCRLPNLIGAAPVVFGVPCVIDSLGSRSRRRV
jgi:hypothetical protein